MIAPRQRVKAREVIGAENRPGVVEHGPAEQNLIAVGQLHDACGRGHLQAVHVGHPRTGTVHLQHDLPLVHPHTHERQIRLRPPPIAQLPLSVQREFDRLRRSGKYDQHRIAGRLDLPTIETPQDVPQHAVMLLHECRRPQITSPRLQTR